jgi:hypothetical protein
MNCYYSNLIEGHNTHPVDIQRALFGETIQDPKKREMQQEAVAHISVQRWIDEGGLGTTVATAAAVLEIHRRFYDARLELVENPETGERSPVTPGAIRSKDVEVGRHFPVSPGPTTVRKDSDKNKTGRPSPFVAFVDALQTHIPKDYRRAEQLSALAQAISKARKKPRDSTDEAFTIEAAHRVE